jgi:hypothetical protein
VVVVVVVAAVVVRLVVVAVVVAVVVQAAAVVSVVVVSAAAVVVQAVLQSVVAVLVVAAVLQATAAVVEAALSRPCQYGPRWCREALSEACRLQRSPVSGRPGTSSPARVSRALLRCRLHAASPPLSSLTPSLSTWTSPPRQSLSRGRLAAPLPPWMLRHGTRRTSRTATCWTL